MPFRGCFLYGAPMEFSNTLVERYQRYMKNRCGVCISYEQAQLHLASLAQLYTSFSFSKKVGVGRGELSSHPHPLEG